MANISSFFPSGGGGVGLGEFVAVPQDGTHTSDQTTNFIIEHNGGKYLRTGITIKSNDSGVLPYSENILPKVNNTTINNQVIGDDSVAINFPDGVRSSVKLTGSGATTFASVGDTELKLTAVVGQDSSNYFLAQPGYSNTTDARGKLFKVNKSTGATTVFTFPFGATAPSSLGGNHRFHWVEGKGLFDGKIICAYWNSSTDQGLIAVNKSDGAVDTGFDTGLFSDGVLRETGTGATAPLYYGLGSNSSHWSGYAQIKESEWVDSSGAAKYNGTTSGNASIPASTNFEMRYVSIWGYLYPGGHYYVALDHATASLRGGINLSQLGQAFKANMLDGAALPTSTSQNFNVTTGNAVDRSYQLSNWGDVYSSASAASTALTAKNTADSTSYDSFGMTAIVASTAATQTFKIFTSNGSIGTRGDRTTDLNKLEASDIVGEALDVEGTQITGSGKLMLSSATDDAATAASFYLPKRIKTYQTTANTGTDVTSDFIIEFPAKTDDIDGLAKVTAQGYVRPMYYDTRDKSISYGDGETTGATRTQRTTGPHTNIHHNNLTSGDKRSKFMWPIWVRIE